MGDNLKTKYSIDPECIPPCKWWQEESERCGPIFHYRIPFDSNNPQTTDQRDTVQKCPSAPPGSAKPGLIWNPEKVTCDKPSNVLGCVGILPESSDSV
ncbi:unnamed protein product [Allacma fusca]|uniref:Uncharacterized protein n=1 Tax=Allacma fusca TaxID=39272 RepID=A0A8J2L0M8_9HEXA|nr:unnamed protein product [Allacma fusca]